MQTWISRHRRSLLLVVGALAAAGVFSLRSLPSALFPTISFPRVVVDLDSGDRPAEEMAALVTYPVEQSLGAIPGVKNVRSATSRGNAQISVNFAWGLDMVAATLQVQAALAQVLPELPDGTVTDVRRMDPTVFPVIAYSLTSPIRSASDLYDIAFYELRPRLSTVPGVAQVAVLGGAIEEIHVVVDPAQLQRFGLTVADVAGALSAANVVRAAGVLEDEYKLYLVLSDTRLHDLADVRETILRSGSGGVVRVDDIGVVSRAEQPKRTIVTADGRTAVLFQVYQQPDGNTVQIAAGIKAELDAAAQGLPADVRIKNWYDQSELITASIRSVRDAVLVGIFLSGLVLFAFLRNVRITLLVGIVVPSVLAATAVLLQAFHLGLNLMTLGGMAAAVALIIDDVIVMIEHIIRRMHEAEDPDAPPDPLSSAMEFLRPLAASSASTIVIFMPLAFLSGVTGAFFKALSITMAGALLISFFYTWMIVPLVSRRLLRRRDADETEGRLMTRVHGRYQDVLERLLARPVLVLAGIIPLVLFGFLAYRSTGSGFMPRTDEGGFILDYRTAPGTSLTETDRLIGQVERILRETPEVDTWSRRTGIQLGGGITEANEGDFFIRLHPPPRRGVEPIIDEVRSRVVTEVPGIEIEMAQLIEDLIGDLTAVPQPIEVKLFSDDATVLDSLAPAIADLIATVPGVVDVNDGIVLAGDALVIRVDRERAALEGMDPDLAAQLIADLVAGAVTTSIQQGEKVVGVRTWVPLADRSTAADLGRLTLAAPDGHRIPVRRLATVERVTGQPQIARDDLKRMVAVTGRLSGRSLGSVAADVQRTIDARGLPPGTYFRMGGLYEQQRIAFRGLIAVFGAALVLVFSLLLFLYEDFRVAVAMMLTTSMAFAAVYVGLWLTRTELNISAMMGLTMIIGIVTEVMIFYFSELLELAAVADRRERLIQAGRNRFRPIAMTTLAAILALLPLALGLGEGSGMLQPLAIAIVSGLTMQLPLALLVFPTLLYAFGAVPRSDPAARSRDWRPR